jgi:putative transposase
MTRRRSLQVVERDTQRLPRLQELKAEHPFWGSRRSWASRRCGEQQVVNKQRLRRLMREHCLVVKPNVKLKAKRTPTRSNPRPPKPHEWGGIDMTKVLVEGCGWISIVLVLDWYTKTIVGYDAGMPCTGQHGLAALDMAVNRQGPEGAQGTGLSLRSDHGCQPTSVAFMQACNTLGIHPGCTSDNHPKGNADTERVIRTLKEECLWRQEWNCPVALIRALENWIMQDNEHDLQSALSSKSPRQCEREYHLSHGTQFTAA